MAVWNFYFQICLNQKSLNIFFKRRHFVGGWQTIQLPILEEAWIEPEPRLFPLDVKVEWEGDAEVAVVDLQDVGDVDLDRDRVRLVHQRNVHAGKKFNFSK